MAIIKCPECGHQISDKAPICPSCGVEIAGKVIKCPNCGEVYFKVQEMCPNCHRPTYQAQVPPVTDPKPVTPPVTPVPPTTPAAPASPVSPIPSATPTAPVTPRPTAQGFKQDAERNSQNRRSQVWSSSYQPSSLFWYAAFSIISTTVPTRTRSRRLTNMQCRALTRWYSKVTWIHTRMQMRLTAVLSLHISTCCNR